MDNNAIAVDAMGGDKAPGEIVAGAVAAAAGIEEQIILVGPEDKIKQALSELDNVPGNIRVEHASGVVAMGEKPLWVLEGAKAAKIKMNPLLVGP